MFFVSRIALPAIICALLFVACGGNGGEKPQYNVIGLRESSRGDGKIGISFSYSSFDDTSSFCGRHVMMFDDDLSFKWLIEKRDTCYMHAMGTFRVSNDTVYLANSDGSYTTLRVERLPSGRALIFSWSMPNVENLDLRYFILTREARYAEDLAYGRGPLWVRFGLTIPQSRRLYHPDVVQTGLYVGSYINDTAYSSPQYDCLWDVRADSTIVEHLAFPNRRVRRTRKFQVKWDPQDLRDTIVLVEPDGSLRKYQLSQGERIRAIDAMRISPYERYSLYDPQGDGANPGILTRVRSYGDYADE